MPYTTPRCGIVRVFHSNRRAEPSAHTSRLSNPMTSLPVATAENAPIALFRSSGWTNSIIGRDSSSSRE
jgi:hypothetical protein